MIQVSYLYLRRVNHLIFVLVTDYSYKKWNEDRALSRLAV